MSGELVRQGLELFEDDFVDPSDAAKSRKKQSNNKDPMKSISSNKQGVWKELKRLHYKQLRGGKRKAKKFTSAVEKYREMKEGNNTEKNVSLLQMISDMGKTTSAVTNIILEQNKGKLAKNWSPVEEEPEKKTVFTDRDFDKFEKEHDFF